MNLLAFENKQQWLECLYDTSFVKYSKPDKWPTVMNETMIKYARHEWEPDAPYVILLNRYKLSRHRDNLYVEKFKGKRMVIIDGGDKAIFWPPYINMCVDSPHVYIKENSFSVMELRQGERYKRWQKTKKDWPEWKDTSRANVRIGCYCPSMKVPFLIKKHKIKWQEVRKLDIMFCGDMHKKRAARITSLQNWANKHNFKTKFGDEHTYGRGKYLEMMAKTRVVPSLIGYGSRCRREWEALLTGAMLWQDKKIHGYPFITMRPEEHFSFDYKWNEKIAKAGYDLAQKCFMRAPSIDIRMAALYLFTGINQLWTYEDVEKYEAKNFK